MIRFDPFWSNLIHSDSFWQIWFNLIKKYIRLKIWWYISMIISSEIKCDQVWSSLIHFGQIWFNLIKKKLKIENLMMYFNDYFIRNPIWSSLIHSDPFWKDLIHSDQKINNIESLMMYFIDYFIRNWKMWKIWGKCRINELCDEKSVG